MIPRFVFCLAWGNVVGYVEDVATIAGERVYVETVEAIERAASRSRRGQAHELVEPRFGFVRLWHRRDSEKAILVPLASYVGPSLVILAPRSPAE